MQVTCHPRLGVPPDKEAGVTEIQKSVCDFYYDMSLSHYGRLSVRTD